MSRFATITDSMAIGIAGPIGFKDTMHGTIHIQIGSSLDKKFRVNVFATLDYDFAANVGSNWVDVTASLLTNQREDIGFALVGGKHQHRRGGGVHIVEKGVYSFDDGFLPAAIQFDVVSIASGDSLKILLGV